MQLHIRYRITDTADDVDVVTNPFSVMQWERKYSTKISRIADDGLGIEDLLYLGWEATKAAGVVVPPFDIWAATVAKIETTGEETNPTK